MSQIKRIIVFGANGMLGHYICTYFAPIVTKITRVECDAAIITENDLLQLFIKHSIDDSCVVFNAIGLIPSAASSLSPDIYITINTKFPIMLANVSAQFGAKMIHATTDCVFSGKRISGNYTEEDLPDETNAYGTSKAGGDAAQCTVIRTSIIGEEVLNKRSLVEWIKSHTGQTVNGYDHHYWNGITCLQYAKIVEQIIEENLFWNGVRHVLSPTPYSKCAILQMINNTFGLQITVDPVSGTPVNKTLDTVYEQVFDIPDLKVQIREMKEFSQRLYSQE